MLDNTEILNKIISWVEEIGKIQMEKINGKLEINTKSSKFDLVTEVDKLSEGFLLEKISNHFPDHSILTEETGLIEKESEYRWVIDPLDGTINYAHGLNIFSISIALEYLNQPIIGVVYIPKLNELYHAVKNSGAYLNGNQIFVSKTKKLDHSLLATGFSNYDSDDYRINMGFFQELNKEVRGIRGFGSAAYEMALVASGCIDGYWEYNLNAWDITAGKLLVEEAGGSVISSQRDKGIYIISGNKFITDQLHTKLKIFNLEYIKTKLNC